MSTYTHTTAHGQTLLDIALQCCGDISVAFEIAAENNLALSDLPSEGQILKVSAVVRQPKIVKYLQETNHILSTAPYAN